MNIPALHTGKRGTRRPFSTPAHSGFFNSMRLPALVLGLMLMGGMAWGQTLYRSANNGTWNTPATWEISTDNGSSWGPTATTPTNANNDGIFIRSPHSVTISVAVTVDQLVVESGGILEVAQILTIANGTGTDMDVHGTVYHGEIGGSNSGVFSIIAGATIAFNDGSTYYLTRTGTRVVPTATWHPNSTLIIGNWANANNIPGNLLGQTFGHFQVGPFITVSGGGYGNLVNSGSGTINVAGNFTLNNGSPAARPIGLNNSSGDVTLNVSGDFIMPGGTFRMKHNAGSTEINVSGNFNKTGGTFFMRPQNINGTATINVTGNFTNSAGTFDLSGVNATGTLNVGGNFSITGGTITETAAGSGEINFTGSGNPQIFSSGSTVAGVINYTVNPGAYLQMALPGTSVAGAGDFILSPGATLGITSPDGITLVGASGNIQVTGLRVFDISASYIYNGSGAQNVGAGLPATMENLTFDNSGGTVSFLGPTIISGIFEITTGSKANLGSLVHVATNLILGGAGQPAGSYGSTSSIAANQNDTYFQVGSIGILNVSTALPIELLFFRGEKAGNTALLTWRTATELNNDYMAVERSTDGRQWEELGRVRGAGTTTTPQDYSFTDEKPLPGINYYRLRQVDYDGAYEYHDVIALEFNAGSAKPSMLLFPNPAREGITLRLSQAMAHDSDVLILDNRGRVLQRRTLPAGAAQWEFDLGGLPAGMYFLRISGGGDQEVLRFVKE